MNHNLVHINGAAGSLGRNFFASFSANDASFNFELADIKADGLFKIEDQVRKKAKRLIIGDMFHEDSHAYTAVTESEADIVIWNAAINLDEYKPVEDRLSLREKQNACLEKRIETLMDQSGTGMRRLLVVVNSVTAIFLEEIDTAKGIAVEQEWHYPLMKGDQNRMLTEYREELLAKGVDLSVLYPGAFSSSFTDPEQALKLANGMGKKVRKYRGRENLKQERILDANEITDAVAKLAGKWSRGEEIPDGHEHDGRNNRQEWIMLNEDDLIVA